MTPPSHYALFDGFNKPWELEPLIGAWITLALTWFVFAVVYQLDLYDRYRAVRRRDVSAGFDLILDHA